MRTKRNLTEQRLDKIENQLCRIEERLKHIISNELPHIWKFLWVILGFLLTILGGIILQLVLKR